VAFESLSEIANKNMIGGRRSESDGGAGIRLRVRPQSKLNQSLILCFFLSRKVLDEAGLQVGNRVDALWDRDSCEILIQKVAGGGRKITSRPRGAGTFQVKYYPEYGMPELSRHAVDDYKIVDGEIIFSL
jgi:hypothetical protein